jgi:diguanylate cyclase (GGDEF)-like protein
VNRSRRKSDVEGTETRLRILAVDDDAAYRNFLRLILNRAGFEVLIVNDGAAALDVLRRDDTIDLVLLDLNMPGMNGIEVALRLKEEKCDERLYTILLTAYDGAENRVHALNNGLDDFLTKLSSESEIIAKIRSAARRLAVERRLSSLNAELQELALTDELTGIANRRALFRAAEEMLQGEGEVSAVLFDLNGFKQVNDTYGHLAGDRILADVAAAFRADTRVGDLVARYGGDEFVLLLPNTTEEDAHTIAQRIRVTIASLEWTIRDTTIVRTSVSYGIASNHGQPMELMPLLAACDDALYRFKHPSLSSGARSVTVPKKDAARL